MGAIGGILGLNGGAAGSGFAAPSGVNNPQVLQPGQLQGSYNGTQSSLEQQQALLNAIQAQNGLKNQSQVYNQLQGVANGTGPNPAQAMLNQATGQNVANQAALMAGQRGAAGNVGLMARQAAQQGGALQQQAVGQGASMQAQQSLNALGQAGSLANQQAANQIGATGALTSAQLGNQGQLIGAQTAQNEQGVQMQGNINNANAGLAGNEMGTQGKILGGAAQGTAIAAMMAGATGGRVNSGQIGSNPVMYAQGGMTTQQPMQAAGPQSSLGKYMGMNQGGKVSALLSPGEKYVSPKEAVRVAEGKESAQSVGHVVPGKALVKGNSLKNDIVPAKLQQGGVVIPRTERGNKEEDFIRACLLQKRKK
jgi:hypothetical protein